MRNTKESNLMMHASYWNREYKIAIALGISAEKKKEINNAINSSVEMLKVAREKLLLIEYSGSNHTVGRIPFVYHTIDDLINKLGDVRFDVNLEKNDIDLKNYPLDQ